MTVDVLLGLQWGDEGKGKVVDYLAPRYDIIARFQGGPNAGHTLVFEDKKHVLHTIPSGIFREAQLNLIGNGVVIDPITLERELNELDAAGVDYAERLFVARKAHLILPTHRYLDKASENAKGKAKIGSTLKGIGPTYMDKTGRNGLRVGDLEASDFQDRYNALKAKHLELLKIYPEVEFDLAGEEEKWMAAIERLRQLKLVNGEYFINEALRTGKRILAEGAQGSMLDIDYGTYPFVTSSNTITAGVCTGLGVSPQKIGEVIGITKAYCTRVGSGPFPTELFDEMGEFLQKEGAEFGATTGRPRRCGWIDLPQLRYTIMLNGVTQLVVTKIDVLNKLGEIKMATAYENNGQQTEQLPYDLCDEDCKPVYESFGGWESGLERAATYGMLPEAAQQYVEEIEARLNVPVAMVSTGPGRRQLLEKVVVA
ncbi:MAG: adenylosuccinate synthase [Bacteroidota bacterium]